MDLNKSQKIATLIYCMGIIIVLFALTPWSEDKYSAARYGTYFAVESKFRVHYKALYFELGILTFLYLMALIYFKTSKSSSRS